jgi:hypothetical protein
MTLYYYICRSWQDCCRRGENRSWPSASVESVDSECWCLNNAIFYAFIMRLTVEERVFILESYVKTISYVHCRQSSILYTFLTSALEEVGWSAPRPGCITPRKDPVPIVQESEWAPGPVWTCAKNLAPTGIRSPNRPVRSQSLYRLSHPSPSGILGIFIKRSFCSKTFLRVQKS